MREPLYLKSDEPLRSYPATIMERLDYWARAAPARIFLAERMQESSWKTVSFDEFRRLSRNVAQALLNRKLDAARPVAVLSGNSIAHAVIGMGAMYAGIPYAPISPSYSLLADDFATLRHCVNLLRPHLIYSDGRGMKACVPLGAELVTNLGPLMATPATDQVDAAQARVTTASVAKLLFTSGSTGLPKAVINTHGMLTSNQAMLCQAVPLLTRRPPVLCDWLPWHHTFGGNHNFNLVLFHGGTLYIDGGNPRPESFAETVRNLEEIAPTAHFNVPRGFVALAAALRTNVTLRTRFFSRLELLFCAAAELPESCRTELQQLAEDTCGRSVPVFSGYGATETAPLALFAEQHGQAGVLGRAVPGLELKLTPTGGVWHLGIRGPNVTPGYWHDPQHTEESFDPEGFFKTGDAATVKGVNLVFAGRLAENFKLATGTWVSARSLSAAVLQACPGIQHLVLAGEGRCDITALVFLDSRKDQARADVICCLQAWTSAQQGSSRRIARAVLTTDTLASETTGKGSVNQKQVLAKYAHFVNDLYAKPSPPHVVCFL